MHFESLQQLNIICPIVRCEENPNHIQGSQDNQDMIFDLQGNEGNSELKMVFLNTGRLIKIFIIIFVKEPTRIVTTTNVKY